jgi:hypothetical protein
MTSGDRRNLVAANFLGIQQVLICRDRQFAGTVNLDAVAKTDSKLTS